MLSKSYRFQRENFPTGRAFKKQAFSWGSVFLYHLSTFKGGVVVSKKAIKKAHDRNRAKRRVYGILNNFTDTPLGVLVRLRNEALTTGIDTIKADLEKALKG